MRGHVQTELKPGLAMLPIKREEGEEFLRMAERHFRELNPAFVPQEDWKLNYFSGLLDSPNLQLHWIVFQGQRSGFILFGLEGHRFLPRRSGMIYELFIDAAFRRQGLARACATEAIRRLRAESPSKVQLEIMEGNAGAEELWRSVGFRKVSERWVLKEEQF